MTTHAAATNLIRSWPREDAPERADRLRVWKAHLRGHHAAHGFPLLAAVARAAPSEALLRDMVGPYHSRVLTSHCLQSVDAMTAYATGPNSQAAAARIGNDDRLAWLLIYYAHEQTLGDLMARMPGRELDENQSNRPGHFVRPDEPLGRWMREFDATMRPLCQFAAEPQALRTLALSINVLSRWEVVCVSFTPRVRQWLLTSVMSRPMMPYLVRTQRGYDFGERLVRGVIEAWQRRTGITVDYAALQGPPPSRFRPGPPPRVAPRVPRVRRRWQDRAGAAKTAAVPRAA